MSWQSASKAKVLPPARRPASRERELSHACHAEGLQGLAGNLRSLGHICRIFVEGLRCSRSHSTSHPVLMAFELLSAASFLSEESALPWLNRQGHRDASRLPVFSGAWEASSSVLCSSAKELGFQACSEFSECGHSHTQQA